jgi:hypothetical protein
VGVNLVKFKQPGQNPTKLFLKLQCYFN